MTSGGAGVNHTSERGRTGHDAVILGPPVSTCARPAAPLRSVRIGKKNGGERPPPMQARCAASALGVTRPKGEAPLDTVPPAPGCIAPPPERNAWESPAWRPLVPSDLRFV